MKAIRVILENQDRWAQVTIALAEPFTGGRLLIYPADFACTIRGVDELAAGYNLQNWEAGLMSGAFHAFRRLKEPRRHLQVSEMAGRLRSEDMPALAVAATLAVTELLGGDRAGLEMPGWQFHVSQAVEPSRQEPNGQGANEPLAVRQAGGGRDNFSGRSGAL